MGSKFVKFETVKVQLIRDVLFHIRSTDYSSIERQARREQCRMAAYEAQVVQAKHDLAHINASIRLLSEPDRQRATDMVSHGFFWKGEITDMCVRDLGCDGELSARDIAERVIVERELDVTDTTLRNSVALKVV